MQSIKREEVPIAIEGDGVEFRMLAVGDLSIAWVRLPAGADLRPGLVGLPDNLCPCPHWGYMISGKLRMHTTEDPQDYEAGEAFYWAAGHGPEALVDCEYIDFSPTSELKAVVDHLRGEVSG